MGGKGKDRGRERSSGGREREREDGSEQGREGERKGKGEEQPGSPHQRDRRRDHYHQAGPWTCLTPPVLTQCGCTSLRGGNVPSRTLPHTVCGRQRALPHATVEPRPHTVFTSATCLTHPGLTVWVQVCPAHLGSPRERALTHRVLTQCGDTSVHPGNVRRRSVPSRCPHTPCPHAVWAHLGNAPSRNALTVQVHLGSPRQRVLTHHALTHPGNVRRRSVPSRVLTHRALTPRFTSATCPHKLRFTVAYSAQVVAPGEPRRLKA